MHAVILAAAVLATPTPIPASTPQTMPYPAYGTPAPGVSVQHPLAGVPVSISLPQAIAIAAARSPVLAIARSDYRLTQLSTDLARTEYYPNLSAVASTQRNYGTRAGTGGSGSGTFGNGTTSNGLNATLKQFILDGGKVMGEIRQAESNQLAGAGTYERSLQSLAFNVAQAYYTALQAHAATQLAAQVVQQNQVQENLVTAQLRAGTASRVDLATAQLPTAQARVALVKAQGNELSAMAAFANQLGLDASALVTPLNDTPLNPTASLLPAELHDYDTAVARALLERPDFLAAQHAADAAGYNLRAQRAGLLPSLNGTATYGTNSTTATGTDYRTSGSLGVALNIPFFDQGVTRVQIAQAQTQLDIANSQLDETKLNVELNVRQALIGLVSAEAALGQAQAELAKAQEILNATQAQYRAGVTTLPLLLNAQVGLTQAETDQLNAVYGLRQAEQAYLFALGENQLAATSTVP
ncbi:MAG TPA: TolC family protein [Candidatus Rubrimentiphilum sp.]|nr:TolC family protein [Candidatus Rubrimentiphilum sp.]